MDDIAALERRVSVLEGEVEGEKVVSRHILEQVRRNADDLASLRGRLGRVEARLDVIEARLDRLEASFTAFRAELPGLVADTMRAVLAERDARR